MPINTDTYLYIYIHINVSLKGSLDCALQSRRRIMVTHKAGYVRDVRQRVESLQTHTVPAGDPHKISIYSENFIFKIGQVILILGINISKLRYKIVKIFNTHQKIVIVIINNRLFK